MFLSFPSFLKTTVRWGVSRFEDLGETLLFNSMNRNVTEAVRISKMNKWRHAACSSNRNFDKCLISTSQHRCRCLQVYDQIKPCSNIANDWEKAIWTLRAPTEQLKVLSVLHGLEPLFSWISTTPTPLNPTELPRFTQENSIGMKMGVNN